MGIERNDDVVNLICMLANQARHTVNILLSPRHEQRTVGMAEINLCVDNEESVSHKFGRSCAISCPYDVESMSSALPQPCGWQQFQPQHPPDSLHWW